MQNIDKIISTDKFKYTTQKGNNYLDFLRTKIAPHISPQLARYMLDFCLSPHTHHSTLKNIKNHFLTSIKSTNTPTIHLILGQTGAGKSTLAQQLLNIHSNTLIIDQDFYKPFNPLSNLILQHTPTYYGHLTGIDSYLHRQALLNTAIDNKFNILIQLAPSQNDLFSGVNLKNFISHNYSIHLHILAVSLPNILLSIHERYENQLLQNHSTPKLTDLNRALDSHNSLLNCLQNQTLSNIQNTTIYTRNYSQNNTLTPPPYKLTPLTPHNTQNTTTTTQFHYCHSTPNQLLQHLLTLQNFNLIQIAHTIPTRINKIKEHMHSRNAPSQQLSQLNQIIDLIASTPIPLK